MESRGGSDGESESRPIDDSGLPPVPSISPQLARSIRATQAAWERVADEFGLLTDKEVEGILGITPTNAESLSVLRDAGKIIAVKRGRTIQYPGFQFDRARRGVFTVIEPLIKIAHDNDWSDENLTLWMIGPTTSFAEENRPVDHLREPEVLLAAAHSHMEEVW